MVFDVHEYQQIWDEANFVEKSAGVTVPQNFEFLDVDTEGHEGAVFKEASFFASLLYTVYLYILWNCAFKSNPPLYDIVSELVYCIKKS